MDSEYEVARSSRASRLARGAGIVAVVGIAIVATYLLIKNSTTEKHSENGGQIKSEPDKERADAGKDATSQIVRLSSETIRKYEIRIGTVRKRKLVSEIAAPARVAFNSEATAVIGTPVQGRVVLVVVRAGDRVRAGEMLAEIESAELGEAQSDYLQRKSAVRTAQATIQPLAEIFERIKRLHDENKLIGITEVQERELELRKAEGTLVTAETAADAAANKLLLLGMNQEGIDSLAKSGKITPRYAVRSPLTGSVVERLINLGELVKPDREKLFVVADSSTLWVWADVPEARAGEVVLGCPAQITLTAMGEQSISGVVSNLSSSIDESTRSLRVRIEVKNDPVLRPGMFAHATIYGKAATDVAEPVLSVPETAIQTINGGAAVFMPENTNLDGFQARSVATGNYANGFVTINSGLQEGDRVVIAGSAILKAELLKASAKNED